MSDLQDLIARNAVMAYNQGVERGAAEERERIVSLLQQLANKLDALRPASYKLVADKMDLRIVTINNVIKLIKEEQK